MRAPTNSAETPDDGDGSYRRAERAFNLGTMLNDAGRYQEAVAPLREAYETVETPEIANNLAVALIHSGKALQARLELERILAKHDDFALLWATHGAALKTMGQPKKALLSFRRALERDPQLTAARLNLATTLHAMGDYAEAIAQFRTVLSGRADDGTAMAGLCRSLQSLEQHGEALAHLAEYERHHGLSVELQEVMALSLERTGQFERALHMVEQCLARNGAMAWMHMIRANCLSALDRHDEAIRAVSKALRDAAGDVTLLHVAGGFMESAKLTLEAVKIYRMILRLDPTDGRANARLFDLRLTLCDWQHYETMCTDLVDQVIQDIDTGHDLSLDVFNLQALPLSYEFIANAARHQASIIAQKSRAIAEPFSHPEPAARRGKIRIGYLLPYTWVHSLPIVLKEIVRNHDRDRFEVIGYCTHPCTNTAFSRSYRDSFDRFVDLPSFAPADAARKIHGDDLDLLIDVAGQTGMNCMDILALRPAPIQAHYLGYSITTGADYIDYLITDRAYIPPRQQAFNSEKPVYLPGTFMATVRGTQGPGAVARQQHGLPRDATVFANFNHPCKFEPSVFSAWMRILQDVPGSVMWFGAWATETIANLRREAEQRGIDGDRLIFADIVERDEHLARLALADLALDTFFHGGGITTVDALWAGLPVLSAKGELPGSRLGQTLLEAAGLPELAVDDLSAYIGKAVWLANNPDILDDYRHKLTSERENSPLFDTRHHCRKLERAIVAMCERRMSGLEPDLIDLTSID